MGGASPAAPFAATLELRGQPSRVVIREGARELGRLTVRAD